MGNLRTVKVACWIAFLKFKGCSYKSTEASHEKWLCPGSFRPIIFRGAEKEIPLFHIETNLKTMGITKKELFDWIQKNC